MLRRRILAVAAMFAGAVGGALLVLHAGTAPALGLATGLLAVVTAGAVLAARRPGPGERGDQSRGREQNADMRAVCSSWRRSWPA